MIFEHIDNSPILIRDMETGETSLLGKAITIEPEVKEIDNEILDMIIKARQMEFHQVNFLDLKCSKDQWNRAMYYFLFHGNNLYLKFPKKLRRKKK